jgi:hypothetical protein
MTQKNENGAMQHNTQCTENLFGRRKYLPDPTPPALAAASVFTHNSRYYVVTFGYFWLLVYSVGIFLRNFFLAQVVCWGNLYLKNCTIKF